jgi:hypothetical protein
MLVVLLFAMYESMRVTLLCIKIHYVFIDFNAETPPCGKTQKRTHQSNNSVKM